MATMTWSKYPSLWPAGMALTTVTCRDHPEIQEKVRRVVMQGHIDPEDFNGVGLPSF